MEAAECEALLKHADPPAAPPNGGLNELLNGGHNADVQGQVSFLW